MSELKVTESIDVLTGWVDLALGYQEAERISESILINLTLSICVFITGYILYQMTHSQIKDWSRKYEESYKEVYKSLSTGGKAIHIFGIVLTLISLLSILYNVKELNEEHKRDLRGESYYFKCTEEEFIDYCELYGEDPVKGYKKLKLAIEEKGLDYENDLDEELLKELVDMEEEVN